MYHCWRVEPKAGLVARGARARARKRRVVPARHRAPAMNTRNKIRALTFAGVLQAVIAAGPVEASADDGSAPWLRVDLSGSDTCSGAAELGARIERRLGRSPEEAARSLEIAMVARIERRRESGWAGEIVVVGPNGATTGRRTLEQGGGACDALVDRLAFVAAMILNSGTATSSAKSRIGPSPTPPAGAVASSEQVDARPTRPRWSLRMEGGAALAVGVLPGSAPGGEASILVGPPGSVVAYVAAGFWPEERASVAPNQGAALSLAMAGAGLCSARWRAAHLGLDLCLGADIGRLRTRGFGLDNQATSDRWAAEVTAGGELRWPTGRGLYLALGARLVVPFIRDQIAYHDSSGQSRELFRMSPLAAVGLIRLGYSHE